MASRGKSQKQQLRDYLADKNPPVINEAVWTELLIELAPISERYLRSLLRETGLPFDQPFAGIKQSSFEELERSLVELERIYSQALSSGDRERARYCRNLVIQAKDRARFTARSPKASDERKASKTEMAQWMLVWLENPEVFPVWVQLRRKRQLI